jgi:endogenous inhibitor of DNA gyrase (YacG/DUF329 family)
MRKEVIYCDRCGKEIQVSSSPKYPYAHKYAMRVTCLENCTNFSPYDGNRFLSDICLECSTEVLWVSIFRPSMRKKEETCSTANEVFGTTSSVGLDIFGSD